MDILLVKPMRGFLSDLIHTSPWPRAVVFGSINLVGGGIILWQYYGLEIIKWGMLGLRLLVFCWWWDMYRERGGGRHTRNIRFALRYGMALFISSEVLFFSAFFWSYFHGFWHPEDEGRDWRGAEYGHVILDPIGLPFLNTLILLVSGIFVTMSHHGVMTRCGFTQPLLFITMMLGIYFMYMQRVEYVRSGFSANRRGYGTLFFVLTGFHGLHVTVGVILLGIALFRHRRKKMKESKHVFHEAAAWYWHFVDVVWLGLYLFIYWYGMDGSGPNVF